jgi:hypothetical protein
MQVKHRRADGTLVIDLAGYPYHVLRGDPLWAAASRMAKGQTLDPEPGPPPPLPMPPTPLQWLDRLPAERQAVMLDALDATPEGRRVQKRILAARSLDPAGADVAACLALLKDVLGAEEIALLEEGVGR